MSDPLRRGAICVLLAPLLLLAPALLLTPALLLGLAAPVASADPEAGGDSDEAPDLFEELLASSGNGEWRGVLNRIREQEDGAWIGQVLGRLFRDRVRYARHAACAAFTAAYFADRAENGRVMLGDAIVERAHGDEAFLEAVRSHITKGEGGWGRLLDHARALLSRDEPRAQGAAVFFLSHEDGDQAERVRRELEARAREVTASADSTARSRLEAEYLGAFDRFLGYRFVALDEALTVLEDLKGLGLARLRLALSLRKDRPDAPAHRTLLEYGKRLVDGVVASGEPVGLEEFLDPERTPHTLIRRYAVQKAAQMSPTADAVWGRMLRVVLARETDPETLRVALTILERAGFAKVPEEAGRLSAELAARLERRGPDAAEARDVLADRVRMAKLLGSLKVRTPALDALLGAGERLETEVVAQIVRALGGIVGVPAKDVLAFYRVTSEDPARDRAIRVAVVDALGRPGFHDEGGDAAAAGAALREILTGEGEAHLGRSADGEVRQHAIRSLGSHPSEETASVLGLLALGEAGEEAGVAVVVLRKAATVDVHAAEALGSAARAVGLSPERRIQALQALGGLLGADEAPRDLARLAARDVLADAGAPEEVRLEAAAASTTLADGLAVESLFAWWAEAPGADRTSALRALLLAVASSEGGEAHDALLRATVRNVGLAGAWDTADALSKEVLAAAPRVPLRLARAEILLDRGLLDGDASTRRAWLAEAALLLKAVLGVEGAPDGTAHLHVRALVAGGDLAEEDESRKALYLEAVARAVADGAVDSARLGLEIADRLLQEPLSALLTEEESQGLTEDRKTLQGRLGP